jgi:hypothetical protein
MAGWVAIDDDGRSHYLLALIGPDGSAQGGVSDPEHRGARGVRWNGSMLWYYPVKWTAPPSGAPPHICNTGCRRATHPECHCQCRGKNHGKENDGEFAESEIIEA